MDYHKKFRNGRVTFCRLAHIAYLIGLMLNRGDAHSPLVIHKLALVSPSKYADDARSDLQARYGTGQHFHQMDAFDESSKFDVYTTTESTSGPDEEGERDILLLGKEDKVKRKAFPQSSKRGWEDFIRCSCCRGNLSAFCCASCPTSMVYRRMVRADSWNPAKLKACQCCEFGNQTCCKLCDLL
ncbi:hypothetical protein CHS0354_041800 [Potamilus streckersoni]|uniref:Uncharacterized protein n=1 Tax=Potamilus streckersoni TaxID=2493646 RepID=A0AAE0T1A5_9BIVA|nr:hypothetical protein CHS0354_041800 [Potamilus streckersoni]